MWKFKNQQHQVRGVFWMRLGRLGQNHRGVDGEVGCVLNEFSLSVGLGRDE
jgi:hypothetical protein